MDKIRTLTFILTIIYAGGQGRAQSPAPIYRHMAPESMSIKKEADSLYNAKDYKAAAEKYKDILRIENEKVPDFYWFDISCCYTMSGDLESGARYLESNH